MHMRAKTICGFSTDDGMLLLAEFGQGNGCDLSQLGGGKHGAAKGADRAGEPCMTFVSMAAEIGMLSSKLAPRSGLQVADGGAAIAADIAKGDDRNLLRGKSFVITDGINLYDGKEQRYKKSGRLSLEPPFTAAKRQALALPIIRRILEYASVATRPQLIIVQGSDNAAATPTAVQDAGCTMTPLRDADWAPLHIDTRALDFSRSKGSDATPNTGFSLLTFANGQHALIDVQDSASMLYGYAPMDGTYQHPIVSPSIIMTHWYVRTYMSYC